jgi:hypothetical protein
MDENFRSAESANFRRFEFLKNPSALIHEIYGLFLIRVHWCPSVVEIKKAARKSDGFNGFGAQLFFRGGLFDFDRGLFAFDVGLAALFMFVFVVLFAHKCLYFVRGLRFCV